MRVTIIVDDGAVYCDGLALAVDLSTIDPNIHAVQWYGDHGEIEYKIVDGVGRPNDVITDLSPFQPHVDSWTSAQALKQAETAAAKASKPVNVIAN